jgi:hypothetical protein
MQIGSLKFQQISFLVASGVGHGSAVSQEDGLLPTALFRRVFVSYSDHFVVLDPQ